MKIADSLWTKQELYCDNVLFHIFKPVDLARLSKKHSHWINFWSTFIIIKIGVEILAKRENYNCISI